MNNEIKARLPFGPENPWYRFVHNLDSTPFKQKLGKKFKEVPANSKVFKDGVMVSITLEGGLFTLRVTFDDNYAFLVGGELTGECLKAGWTYHSKAPGNLLFRKEVKQVDDTSHVATEFIPILTILGVDPNQDWGI